MSKKLKTIKTFRKALLIDDHEEFRQTVKDYLEKQCDTFKIFEAATGKDGIQQALKEKPDIILMDIRLPDISGIDAARQIKKSVPSCKVIMLTMFESAAFRHVYDFHDMDGYIGKNELHEKLVERIEEALTN